MPHGRKRSVVVIVPPHIMLRWGWMLLVLRLQSHDFGTSLMMFHQSSSRTANTQGIRQLYHHMETPRSPKDDDDDVVAVGAHHQPNRRVILSFLGSMAATATTAHAQQVVTNDDESDGTTSVTTLSFNPDGSLKDTTGMTPAQERTITLDGSTNHEQRMSWRDGRPTIPTTTMAVPMMQYNLPMKWDDQYLDSTTKERACTRIYTYRIPYPNSNNNNISADNNSNNNNNNSDPTKGKRRRSIGPANNNRDRPLSLADILLALPLDEPIRSVLQTADLMGGRVRRSVNNNNNNEDDDRCYYSDLDLAVAPSTCSGSDNEDLRLGFCPYDRVFLLSATTTTTNDADDADSRIPTTRCYLSILIVESTRSEWQRANADLRRVRGSFTVLV